VELIMSRRITTAARGCALNSGRSRQRRSYGAGATKWRAIHVIVNQIIMLPDFSQGGVKLQCETEGCCLKGPVCCEHRIPQPPSPPGFGVDRAHCSALRVSCVVKAGASRPFFTPDFRAKTSAATRMRRQGWRSVFPRHHSVRSLRRHRCLRRQCHESAPSRCAPCRSMHRA
jgi:hypothetical protein